MWAQLVQALGVRLLSTWIKTRKVHSSHLAPFSHIEGKEMLLLTHHVHCLENL